MQVSVWGIRSNDPACSALIQSVRATTLSKLAIAVTQRKRPVFATLGGWWKSLSDSCKYLGASLAIVMVKRKLNQRPHDWSLWLTLARLYEIGYQWPQALDAVKHARKLNPQNKVIGEVLARVEQAAKQDSRDKVQSEN